MIYRLAIAAAIAAGTMGSVVPTKAYASKAIFDQMEGKFRGKGLVKATAKGKKESIRCRMTNKPAPDGKRLDISGNCAVSGFIFSLRGYMEQTSGKNYRASMFRSLANIRQDSFGGRRNGNRINFKFSARDSLSRKPIKASIRLDVKNTSNYTFRISRTDPASGKVFDVGTINFSKR